MQSYRQHGDMRVNVQMQSVRCTHFTTLLCAVVYHVPCQRSNTTASDRTFTTRGRYTVTDCIYLRKCRHVHNSAAPWSVTLRVVPAAGTPSTPARTFEKMSSPALSPASSMQIEVDVPPLPNASTAEMARAPHRPGARSSKYVSRTNRSLLRGPQNTFHLSTYRLTHII